MEEKASMANLALLDPIAKMVRRSGMRFERYKRVAPTVEI